MNKLLTPFCAILLMAAPAFAAPITFTGLTDGSGFKVAGVYAPVGSDFTLNLNLSLVGSGVYSISGISYTITTGTYTTAGSWAGELIDATNNGGVFSLQSNPLFDSGNNLGEQFLLNVHTSSFAGLDVNNTGTWSSTPWVGDFIVRGQGGFGSGDGFSTNSPFSGTATLHGTSTVPDSGSTLALLGLALLGFVGFRRKFVA